MGDAMAPGFRFHPTEEELVGFYLKNKLAKKREDELETIIPVLDIYCYDPWQLPGLVGATRFTDDDELFFFVPRNEKETQGGRSNRIAPTGYWKATGSPVFVYSSQKEVIGVRKTLVFYKGKGSASKKTKWKKNEYKTLDNDPFDGSIPGAVSQVRSEFSLCRIYIKTRCLRAFDPRPLSPIAEEMASKKPKTCSWEGSSTNLEAKGGVEKEKQVLDDIIDWEMLGNLYPSESWRSI